MKKQKKIKKQQLPELNNNALSMEDWEELDRGVNYFNDGNLTHALEAFKLVSERCVKSDRSFIQSLIDMIRIFQKADRAEFDDQIDKLIDRFAPYLPEQCGISVSRLLTSLRELRALTKYGNVRRIGTEFLTLKLRFSPPSNPDIDVEVAEICANPQFLEGISLFNKGYYWEAHENWEGLWRDQSGHGKNFIETFVQMAEGYSFAKKGKTDSAMYLLGKVIQKFQEFGRVQCGISVIDILRDVEKVVLDIHTYRSNGNTQFKFTSQPAITLIKRDKRGQ